MFWEKNKNPSVKFFILPYIVVIIKIDYYYDFKCNLNDYLDNILLKFFEIIKIIVCLLNLINLT